MLFQLSHAAEGQDAPDLHGADISSVKAEARRRLEAAAVPRLRPLRYFDYLQHMPQHCIYGHRARRVLSALRWLLLALQVISSQCYSHFGTSFGRKVALTSACI